MRRALPTPAHKHPPRRGDSGAQATATLGLVADCAPIHARPPPSFPARILRGPSWGLDVLDLVRAGVELATDPLAFGAELMRGVLGEGLDWARRKLDGLLDRVAPWVDDVSLALVALWEVCSVLPVTGPFIAAIEQMVSNFCDMVVFTLMGDVADPSNPDVGNLTCPGQLPVYSGSLKYQDFKKLIAGEEIALRISSALVELLPTYYVFRDDAPPLSWATFEGRATLREGHWDVDDDFATDMNRQHSLEPNPPLYVKAWKLNDRRILAEVGPLRCISFLPCSRVDEALVYEHEGDGEPFYAHIQVDPTDPASPADSELATLRLTGLIGQGHSEKHLFDWKQIEVRGARAGIGAARGSHATSVGQGRVRAGADSFKNLLNVDYFPEPGETNVTTLRGFRIETDSTVLAHLYESGGEYWGKDKVVSDCYKAWSSACGLEQEYIDKIKPRFPLDPCEVSECQNGSACTTCPAPITTDDSAPARPGTSAIGANRSAQIEDDLLVGGAA